MGSSEHRATAISLVVRYAPYLEEYHQAFLGVTRDKVLTAIIDSPYGDYTPIEVNNAFFSIGLSISDYPTLYDMFGKHMSGFDVEVLYRSDFENLFTKSEINSSVAAAIGLVNDDVITKVLNKFQTAMRDINSVITSSFIVGKAMVENMRVKKLSEISSKAKFELISDPQKSSNAFLSWAKKVVTSYAESMKLYYSAAMDVNEINFKMKVQDVLWPLIILDFERSALSSLKGQTSYQKVAKRQRSALSKALLIASYGVTGITVGASIGGWVGAVIGAVVGIIVGLAMVLLE
jgi:hypothetical protein